MKRLSIPENISLKKQFVKGIGSHELRQIAIAFVPVAFFVTAYWAMEAQPWPRLIALASLILYGLCCFVVFSCPDGEQSIYTFISLRIRFSRSQKAYYFRQRQEVIYFEEKE